MGALGISWRIFGTSGETKYKPLPVTKRFTLGHGEVDWHIKFIARLVDVEFVAHFDFVIPKSGFMTVDTNMKGIYGPFNPGGPSDVAVIHHFRAKSIAKYKGKRARGRADINCSPPKNSTGARRTMRAIITITCMLEKKWTHRHGAY